LSITSRSDPRCDFEDVERPDARNYRILSIGRIRLSRLIYESVCTKHHSNSEGGRGDEVYAESNTKLSLEQVDLAAKSTSNPTDNQTTNRT
jgi:hypothetical protein